MGGAFDPPMQHTMTLLACGFHPYGTMNGVQVHYNNGDELHAIVWLMSLQDQLFALIHVFDVVELGYHETIGAHSFACFRIMEIPDECPL